MTTETMMVVLRMHPFVDEFRPQHIEKLNSLAREVHFERGQTIFRQGEECNQFFLIVSGKVALEITAPGRTFLVQTLGSGDELGWSSMLMHGGKHFQARVVEPVEALAFQGEELLRACRDDPAFGFALMHRMLGVVSERLQVTRLQLLDIYSPRSH